nr:hypothetical protein CFP56_20539 [Quercus suber]
MKVSAQLWRAPADRVFSSLWRILQRLILTKLSPPARILASRGVATAEAAGASRDASPVYWTGHAVAHTIPTVLGTPDLTRTDHTPAMGVRRGQAAAKRKLCSSSKQSLNRTTSLQLFTREYDGHGESVNESVNELERMRSGFRLISIAGTELYSISVDVSWPQRHGSGAACDYDRSIETNVLATRIRTGNLHSNPVLSLRRRRGKLKPFSCWYALSRGTHMAHLTGAVREAALWRASITD